MERAEIDKRLAEFRALGKTTARRSRPKVEMSRPDPYAECVRAEPSKFEANQLVTICPLCGEPYTKPLHAVPESQPESFRKQVTEMRHVWFHRPEALTLSSAEREEYWCQAIEEAKADRKWAHLFDPAHWQRKEETKGAMASLGAEHDVLVAKGLTEEQCLAEICRLGQLGIDAVCSVGSDGRWQVWAES